MAVSPTQADGATQGDPKRITLGATKPTARMVPLVLSAKRATWRMNDVDHSAADAEFQVIRGSILRENKFTCMGEGCHFASKKWQEVHHRDDNHANNTAENLVTLCPFCHNVFHIGRAAMDGARLVWLPELQQGPFNAWLRLLYFGADTATEIGNACRALLGALEGKVDEAATRLGFSDPAVLAEAMIMVNQQVYEKREEKLDGLLLMSAPRKTIGGRDVWPEQMAFWRSSEGPFSTYSPKIWPAMFDACNRALGRQVVNAAAAS